MLDRVLELRREMRIHRRGWGGFALEFFTEGDIPAIEEAAWFSSGSKAGTQLVPRNVCRRLASNGLRVRACVCVCVAVGVGFAS